MLSIADGGLRAGMDYCDMAAIEELYNVKLTRITSESHPHDVMITRELLNYIVRGKRSFPKSLFT
jgi:hypothetical protein